MIVFLNGAFIPAEEAKVSVFDRSFLYGDGLFESIRVNHGTPFRLPKHLERLQLGAEYLGIRLPFSIRELEAQAAELMQRAGMPDALLRINLSRGLGGHGYSPRDANRPLLAMTLHPAPAVDPKNPAHWRLVSSSIRIAAKDPLALFKTCNKLHHILARREAESQGADEALLLNTNGQVAEGAGSNVFWIEPGVIFTTPWTSAALPGVTRAVVMEICHDLGIIATEQRCSRTRLEESDGVFLSLSSHGIVEAVSLDGKRVSRSPITRKLHRAYQELLSREGRGSDQGAR